MNYKRTPPQPPPVPASPRAGQEPNDLGFTDYGSGHLHREAPQHDKPGYRQQVVLLPEQAQEIRDVVQAAIHAAKQCGAVEALMASSDELVGQELYHPDEWLEERAHQIEGE